MRMVRSCRWDYGEKGCAKDTCVVGKGKMKAGSSTGLCILGIELEMSGVPQALLGWGW